LIFGIEKAAVLGCKPKTAACAYNYLLCFLISLTRRSRNQKVGLAVLHPETLAAVTFHVSGIVQKFSAQNVQRSTD
jgi:hypothetical protein